MVWKNDRWLSIRKPFVWSSLYSSKSPTPPSSSTTPSSPPTPPSSPPTPPSSSTTPSSSSSSSYSPLPPPLPPQLLQSSSSSLVFICHRYHSILIGKLPFGKCQICSSWCLQSWSCSIFWVIQLHNMSHTSLPSSSSPGGGGGGELSRMCLKPCFPACGKKTQEHFLTQKE